MLADIEWSPDEGALCRHWVTRSSCSEKCAECGHSCFKHDIDADGECAIAGCACKQWRDIPGED